MGNLLAAPLTDKETHRGVTKDEKLKFGLSSMQGWRVHMEDAHIAEGEIYALEVDKIAERAQKYRSMGIPFLPSMTGTVELLQLFIRATTF